MGVVGCVALHSPGPRAMTILEGVIALVVLGVSAVGYLDVFRGGADATSRAAGWTRAVSVAEAAMEAASLGDPLQAQQVLGAADPGVERRIEARPWGNVAGLTEVVVTVRVPGTPEFTLRRLVRDGRSQGPIP